MCVLAFALHGCEFQHPIKLGSNQWPGYEPVYLARSLGYLEKDDVKLVELPSSTEVMQFLRTGTLDAGMLTLNETLTLLNQGLELQAVLIMDFSQGGDSVLAQPDIQHLEQIAGHRIGVELTAVGAIMLQSLLDQAGITLEQVQLVHLPVDEQEQAFLQKKVDALVTFEPTRSLLLQAGARELFNSRQIPERIIDVLVVRKDALQHHDHQLRAVIKAYFRARNYMQEQPQDAYRRIAARLHVEPSTVANMYQGLRLPTLQENSVWLSNGQLQQNANSLLKLMQDWQLIDVAPETSHLANPAFLPDS